jgi:hypothetical protein
MSRMNRTESKTDWNRVLAHQDAAQIPYEPEDGPYDPNDAGAARTWLAQADVIHKGKVAQTARRSPQN